MLKKGTMSGDLTRYAVVGFVAFAVDFGTLFFLKNYWGVHYLLAGACGFALGLGINYLLSTAWVFQNRKMKKRSVELAVFALIGVVGLGINEFILYTLTGLFLVYYLYSKIFATVIVFFWNFLARRYTLFKAS